MKLPKEPKFLLFGCGCIKHSSKIKPKKRKKRTVYICPKHGEKLIKILDICTCCKCRPVWRKNRFLCKKCFRYKPSEEECYPINVPTNDGKEGNFIDEMKEKI